MDYSDIPLEYSTPSNFTKREEEPRGVGLIKDLSPQEHLKEIIMWLRGLVWDNNQKSYIEIKGVKPFMNEEGISVFFHYATSVISPIITFSDYGRNTELIHRLVCATVNHADVHFHVHYKQYGIQKKGQIGILKLKLLNLGLSAFYKAVAGGDRKAATQNITENINTLMRNPTQEKMRRGFFSRFTGGGNYG